MASWKSDRTAIFLCVIFLLFLWDLAYFLGVRNPDRFPHPFVIFGTLGDVEFLRGFPRMLRYMIFSSVSGGLIGIGVARLILPRVWLTQSTLRALRLGLWLPFLILFATPAAFALTFAAAMLCGCYHYLAAISILGLESRETRTYVAQEITLQILLFYLLSQIWLRYWNWLEFAATYQPATGLGALITLTALLFFINWIFRSNFDLTAERRGTILKHFHGETWKSACGFLLFAFSFLIFWCLVGCLRFPGLFNSPLRVVEAGYDLVEQGEIYRDVGVSLLELLGGTVLGGSLAILVIALVSADSVIKKAFFLLLPLSNISPIVLWLFSWVAVGWILPAPRFLDYWHKVIAVGCLTFFPFVQALRGVRDRPMLYRILLAIDNALPVAFVAMCYGEMYAATAGLGFMMVVASATSQFDKGLAGFLVAVVLLTGLSSILRWTAGRLHFAEINTSVHPAPVT